MKTDSWKFFFSVAAIVIFYYIAAISWEYYCAEILFGK